MKLSEGYIFTPVCLFAGGMMSFSVWSHVLSRECHFLSGPIFFLMVHLEGEGDPPPKGVCLHSGGGGRY